MERSPRIGSLKPVIRSLDSAAGKAGLTGLKVILCGGLAMIAYGMPERSTLDIDAEIDVGFDVIRELKESMEFPAELSADISRWSMIDIPSGYRDRADQGQLQYGATGCAILNPMHTALPPVMFQ